MPTGSSVKEKKGPLPGAKLKDKAKKILATLKKEYPGSKCSLIFKNPFELLMATILSAQCTDERVNKVTPALFKNYPNPEAFARADLKELEDEVRPTGFYRSKARSIHACSKEIGERFGGRVPSELDDLISLHGVGRKTANVVLGNAFGKEAVVVETHVIRISNRLGLTRVEDPVKMEFEFMELFPRKDWSHLAHLFIDHGRAVCKAPKPRCEICKLTSLCDYYRKNS